MAIDEIEQARLRLLAFDELELLVESGRGFFTRDELVDFKLEGRSFPLIDRGRGIRNPASFDATLSIVSAAGGPYDDHIGRDGLLRYAFQAGDPSGGDNRKLRIAMLLQTPIILFEKPLPNVYVPILPAYVIDEDVQHRHFLVATDQAVLRAHESGALGTLDRRYVEQLVRRRVHQPVFRARVIVAYDGTCAMCRLKHPQLLDAAHIIPDHDARGLPLVTNGLSLCKIHHAAYDSNMLGISPDYRVHVDRDLLEEVDGPMLKYGIQGMHGAQLALPRRLADHPSRDALDERFAAFQR